MKNISFPGEITAQKFFAGGMWLLEESRLPSMPQPENCTNQLQTDSTQPEEMGDAFTIKASYGRSGTAVLSHLKKKKKSNRLNIYCVILL